MTLASAALGQALHDLASSHASAGGRPWRAPAAVTSGAFDRDAFTQAFTVAARHLGASDLRLTAGEAARLAALGANWPLTTRLDELGRVALLILAAAHLSETQLVAVLEDCYEHGDTRERRAVLRTLPLLPVVEGLVAIAVDACRSHVQPLFEAIACENPYPAAQFPEVNFNQMVLKALFIGVALERIMGLSARVTPELRRMADDYARERIAAGRSVPADIGRLTG